MIPAADSARVVTLNDETRALRGFSWSTWVHLQLAHMPKSNEQSREKPTMTALRATQRQNLTHTVKGHTLCCQNLLCTQKHACASIMFTHMHRHGSCNSTSCQLLSQRNACTSLPIPESLYKEIWNSYSMYPSPSLSLSFSSFSHHWLCPNLATSEG